MAIQATFADIDGTTVRGGKRSAMTHHAQTIDTRRLTLLLGVNQLVSWATTFYLPAVIAFPASVDLSMSPTLAMGGFSWALVAASICAPRIGGWIGEHGGRGPMALGTLLIASGLLTLAPAHGVAQWYVGWTVLGIGMALGLYDAAFATAGTLLGTSVGPAITGITLLGGLSSAIGWPIGTALLQVIGWRGVLVVFAASQIVVNLPLVLAAVPPGAPPAHADRAPLPDATGVDRSRIVMGICMASFFSLRWLLTSGIAAHVLILLKGLGLSAGQAMAAAMIIGPGQVLGRMLEWMVAGWLDPLSRARLGAVLFPLGAVFLLIGSPYAVIAFALLYGMSNGIMTINRGTLPMLVLGPAGYARLLGWLAIPVLLAQAAAPALFTPLVARYPAPALLFCAAAVAALSAVFLLFLRPLRRLPGQS